MKNLVDEVGIFSDLNNTLRTDADGTRLPKGNQLVSQVIHDTETLPVELQILYAPVFEELQQSEVLLQKELRSTHNEVDEMIQHGCRLGGKRLRPVLLLLSAKANGRVVPAHLVLAAVVEMIHTATLIHDDVLDEATLRRHVETCNERWDNKPSVLLGDYLFTHAFYLASTLGSNFACQTIGKATNIVCEGELRQIRSCTHFDLGEATYLDIITAKTASLCECACRLGAYFGNSDEDGNSDEEIVNRFASYGLNLGIAFQIIDDLLDVVGTEDKVGKSLGTDLNQHKPTLPLIHVLEQLDSADKSHVLTSLTQAGTNGREILQPWFERFDTENYVKQKAESFARQAFQALEPLPGNEALDTLRQIPEFVLHRSR